MVQAADQLAQRLSQIAAANPLDHLGRHDLGQFAQMTRRGHISGTSARPDSIRDIWNYTTS
jgi:hypothetical protein